MGIYSLLVAICWGVFLLVWLVGSFSAKKNVNAAAMMRWIGLRMVIVVVIAVGFRSQIAGRFAGYRFFGTIDPVAGWVGVALCAAGIAFAIWARVYLGRNWGMPMSVKEDPELVTSGPYAYVRHPIYTGMLLAMLGSGIVGGASWLFAVALLGAYFAYTATQEEKLMQKQFPEAYPAYKKRTKMLIPFVF
jgi:protein-S-isoprenylcysteine O-methyltransferase Ste14